MAWGAARTSGLPYVAWAVITISVPGAVRGAGGGPRLVIMALGVRVGASWGCADTVAVAR
ncbi:hypothetical protein GCM10009608_52910 [Pseudonocardia alaniniphila]